MENKLVMLQKSGLDSMESQVVARAKAGRALYGSPFIMAGLQTQLMRYTGTQATNPGYYSVTHKGPVRLPELITPMLDEGWRLYMEPYEYGGFAVQTMIFGDIAVLPMESGDTPVVTPANKLVFVNSTRQYVLSEKDNGTHILFDGIDEVKVYLPVLDGGSNTVVCKLTNLYGTVEINPQGTQLSAIGLTTLSRGTVEMTGVRNLWIANGFLQ